MFGTLSGRIDSVYGREGIVPQLHFRLRVRQVAGIHFNVINSDIPVFVSIPDRYKNPQNEHYIGRAHWEDRNISLHPNGDSSWDFSLDIDHNSISRIEEVRRGQALFLSARVMIIGSERTSQDQTAALRIDSAILQDENNPSRAEVIKHLIAKSEWLEILKQLGYANFYDLELPLPKIKAATSIARGLARLEDARNNFLDGKDRETLASCYGAFEALAKQAGKKHADQAAFAEILGSLNAFKKERLKLAFNYMSSFMQPGRHELVDVDHRDAELALLFTHIALSYIAKADKPTKRKSGQVEETPKSAEHELAVPAAGIHS